MTDAERLALALAKQFAAEAKRAAFSAKWLEVVATVRAKDAKR